MYSVKLKNIRDQIRNCVVSVRGDWLFSNTLERDTWLKEMYDISVWSGGREDEIIFKNEKEYLMFMLRWS